MAIPPPDSSNPITRPGGASAPQGGVVDKFKALPKATQILIAGAAAVGLLWVFGGGGGSNQSQQSLNMAADGANTGEVSSTNAFKGLETDRPALMQNVYEQNRRDLAEFRSKIEEYFQQQSTDLQTSKDQNAELQRQMQQMMADFSAEIKNLQAERAKDAERLAQLAAQQQQMELNSPVGGTSGNSPISAPRQRIKQIMLSGGSGGTKGQPLFAPLGQAFQKGMGGLSSLAPNGGQAPGARLPFVPPLGFVKATLLNGIDAFVGGSPALALARISGNYKTAMNNSVSLDGCIVLMEFSANISTERAIGKPVRMTCVYPDGGAATYNMSGYVVDVRDGVIGVPGILKEGDPNRIAGAIMADFAAGAAQIASQNQNTTNQTGTFGTIQSTVLSGDQTKQEIAKGIEKSMSQLRDYIKERADRIQPFIRLDALREVNLVLLSGQELRAEASPWTLLFDAKESDSSRGRGVFGGLGVGQVPAADGNASPQPQQGQQQ